jgi:hypothetical protein
MVAPCQVHGSKQPMSRLRHCFHCSRPHCRSLQDHVPLLVPSEDRAQRWKASQHCAFFPLSPPLPPPPRPPPSPLAPMLMYNSPSSRSLGLTKPPTLTRFSCLPPFPASRPLPHCSHVLPRLQVSWHHKATHSHALQLQQLQASSSNEQTHLQQDTRTMGMSGGSTTVLI